MVMKIQKVQKVKNSDYPLRFDFMKTRYLI